MAMRVTREYVRTGDEPWLQKQIHWVFRKERKCWIWRAVCSDCKHVMDRFLLACTEVPVSK